MNRWQRKAIDYFKAVLRSWPEEERVAAMQEIFDEFGAVPVTGMDFTEKDMRAPEPGELRVINHMFKHSRNPT